MKKLLILLLIISFTFGITACAKSDTATADQKETRTPTVSGTEAAPPTAAAPTDAPEATAALTQTDAPEPTRQKSSFDPYATANDYDLSSSWVERQSGTDYGTLVTDVTYFSTTADDNKRVNILLSPYAKC